MSGDIEHRRKRYFRMSTALAGIGDKEILYHLDRLPHFRGWGQNQFLNVDGTDVFLKRVPVTDLEMKNAHSTQNLYRLPTFYNYGVGSAGFGIFRELFGHIKTTNWVLEGATENFPLLYHHRIVPRARRPENIDEAKLTRHVNYWNGSEEIRQFRWDREYSNFEALIFLGTIPYTVTEWLNGDETKLAWYLEGSLNVIHFMQSNDIIHFDVQRNNLLTDGHRIFLTDFGLILDNEFELEDYERKFFEAHRRYDEGEFYYNLMNFFVDKYRALSDRRKREILGRYGIRTDELSILTKMLLDNVEDIVANGLLEITEKSAELMLSHRPVMALYHDFFTKMRAGSRKDYDFPNEELQRLLA